MAGESERRLLVNYEPANGGPKSSAVARDAALGGLFIETQKPLPVGSLLSVELSSPNSSVSLDARVFSSRAKAEGKDKPAGMGVTFLDLPAGALGKLTSILQHHRPPARTRLGVGDEKEALWGAAGGKEGESAESASAESDAMAAALNISVEGRPTPEIPAPIENDPILAAPDDPMPARYPTPRMIPITPRSGAQLPASVPPPPSSAPMGMGGMGGIGGVVAPQLVVRPPRSTVAIIAIVVIVLLGLVGMGILFLLVLR